MNTIKALPGTGAVIANLSTTDPDVGNIHTYALLPGSSAGFEISADGIITRTCAAMTSNSTYLLNIRTTDNTGLSLDETFTIRTLANGVANVFTGTSTDDLVYGLTSGDTLSGGAGVSGWRCCSSPSFARGM